jgi:hypothetical protein
MLICLLKLRSRVKTIIHLLIRNVLVVFLKAIDKTFVVFIFLIRQVKLSLFQNAFVRIRVLMFILRSIYLSRSHDYFVLDFKKCKVSISQRPEQALKLAAIQMVIIITTTQISPVWQKRVLRRQLIRILQAIKRTQHTQDTTCKALPM